MTSSPTSRPDPSWLSTGPWHWPSSRARNLAWRLVDALGLENYYLFHAVRADFLVRLGRRAEAAAAYRSALELVRNAADRNFLEARLRAARAGPGRLTTKAPAVRCGKMGETRCRPPVPGRHPHACRITRTLNEVTTTLVTEFVKTLT